MYYIEDKILVFIPVYNCEAQISRVINRFSKTTFSLFNEILIVDNGSLDNSLKKSIEVAKLLNEVHITVIQNKYNYNLGGSHKVAFNYALDNKFDYVVVIHGDDQGDINDVLPIFKNNDHRNYNCLLGSRFLRGSKLIGYSSFRIIGNWGLNLVGSIITKKMLYDLGAGLNIYNTNMLKSRFYLKFPNGLTFNYYMMFYTVGKKLSFKYFPLTWREEDQVSTLNLFNHLLEWLGVIKIYLFNYNLFINEYHCEKQKYEYKKMFTNKHQ